MLENIHQRWASMIILMILMAGAYVRLTIYKDLRLSIGMPDTISYIHSASAPLFSWESFSGRRLFTANLLYRLMDHELGCEISAESFPALNEEGTRAIQPCFNRIVLLQNGLSVVAWCLLAWTTSRWFTNPLYKISIAVIITLFGLSPQIAEWDSVLSSEALAVSLFALMLAFLQELIMRMAHGKNTLAEGNVRLFAWIWLIVFILWVFLRDVHIYTIPFLLLLMAPLYFVESYRRSKTLWAFTAILAGLFVLGSVSARNSNRWQPGFDHTLNFYIFPYPARMEFFISRGMPDPSSTDEYWTWIDEDGQGAYARFLISHPGFIVTTLSSLAHYFDSDFLQPYYEIKGFESREALINIGKAVHPETNAVYIIDVLLLIGLLMLAYKERTPVNLACAGMGVWIFMYAATSLLISGLTDVDGTRRHIYPSVETFRLFFWIFSLMYMDRLTARVPASTTSDQPAN